MGLLAEARKAGPPRATGARSCAIGAWLTTLSDSDRADAEAILARTSGWEHKDVTSLFYQLKVPGLFKTTVSNHRRGDCTCDQPE